ncbi:hypothetical protein JXB41_03530 [Candidatus Woesearchaeota archaeon]|nr:hypothetical protein [Candidatus Woesearchaeota archaeon]
MEKHVVEEGKLCSGGFVEVNKEEGETIKIPITAAHCTHKLIGKIGDDKKIEFHSKDTQDKDLTFLIGFSFAQLGEFNGEYNPSENDGSSYYGDDDEIVYSGGHDMAAFIERNNYDPSFSYSLIEDYEYDNEKFLNELLSKKLYYLTTDNNGKNPKRTEIICMDYESPTEKEIMESKGELNVYFQSDIASEEEDHIAYYDGIFIADVRFSIYCKYKGNGGPSDSGSIIFDEEGHAISIIQRGGFTIGPFQKGILIKKQVVIEHPDHFHRLLIRYANEEDEMDNSAMISESTHHVIDVDSLPIAT